jgi:hypothetical protein
MATPRSLTRTLVLMGVATVVAALPGNPSAVRATSTGWVTLPSAAPLFDLATIAPGDSGSATLTVTNPQTFPATFSIAVVGLTNDDNGCNEPETRMGDTTCGPGGGELQIDLLLTLSAVGTDASAAVGSVADWATHAAIDPVDLRGFEARTYRIGYELPIATSNITQSDLLSFRLELRLDQSSEASTADPPSVVIVASDALPRTGADHDAVLIAAAAATLAGLCLCLVRLPFRRRHVDQPGDTRVSRRS